MTFLRGSALPLLLGVMGGYVDMAGYLALQGLFTSHVTGNFVTIGASMLSGATGTLAKLLALPTFCAVIVVARLTSIRLQRRGWATLQTLLGGQLVLLLLAAFLALRLGPFPDGDSGSALATGLVLVAAMAIQNAVQRIDLGGAPPSTVMTMTTTQIMIDLAEMTQSLPEEQRQLVRARLQRMVASVAAFASGCAAAALLYASAGVYCFALPPMLGLAAVLAGKARSKSEAA